MCAARLVAVLAVLLPCGAVLAAAPAPAPATPPIVDDLGKARALEPERGLLISDTATPEPEVELVSRSLVIAHARWITVPSPILDLFFQNHPALSNASAGLAVELGPPAAEVWAIEFDWTAYGPDAGNWLELTKDPADATYADGALHMLSIDVNYRRQVQFGEAFRMFFGAGLGVGVLLGDLHLAEVLPTCTAPVAECAHWPNATHRDAEMPTRVVPIVHLTAGAEVDIGGGLVLRLQGGFRNAVYAGIGIGAAL